MGVRRGPEVGGSLRDHGVAAAWGFAEATVFFVVPDVWTSWVGMRRPKRALGTTLSALGGAMLGGAATFAWAQRVPAEQSQATMAKVPGITAGMVEDVELQVTRSGHAALMRGPIRGVPYKLYARASGVQHKSLPNFLAWSVPGRLIRFVLVTWVSSRIAALARRRFPEMPERARSTIFWVSWAGFYAWFIPGASRRSP